MKRKRRPNKSPGICRVSLLALSAYDPEHGEKQMSDRTGRGLYSRYRVTKAFDEPVDPLADYFVLRLDENGSDQAHVGACREAAMKYALEILCDQDPKPLN